MFLVSCTGGQALPVRILHSSSLHAYKIVRANVDKLEENTTNCKVRMFLHRILSGSTQSGYLSLRYSLALLRSLALGPSICVGVAG